MNLNFDSRGGAILLFMLAGVLFNLLAFVVLRAQEDNVNEEVEDDGLDVGDDQVDQWEAVPLPPPSEADLIRDSDELYQMHNSDVKRMIEKEEQYLQSLVRTGKWVDKQDEAEFEEMEAELMEVETKQGGGGGGQEATRTESNFPIIFNTDDFDDEHEDVPGDSPVAPLLEKFL